jgi:hypothetical protein
MIAYKLLCTRLHPPINNLVILQYINYGIFSAYVVLCKLRVYFGEKLMKCRPCRQHPTSRDTEYPLMFLYTGISRLGDGMALYMGDSGDPVFCGWLQKSTPDYFAIVRHLRADRRVLVRLLVSRFTDGCVEKGLQP